MIDRRKESKAFGGPGFTLTEILVTIVIMAILAGLALPRYNMFMKKMKSQEAVGILLNILSDQLSYYKDNGSYATQMTDLDVQVPTPKNFNDVVPGSVTLDCSGTPRETVANMEFKDTSFKLYVTTDGQIVCKNTGGGPDPCPSLGFLSCI